jgi:hypothetical protein
MNATNMTGTCPSTTGGTSHKSDVAIALTPGVLHAALMVLAVVLAYAQPRRTPPLPRVNRELLSIRLPLAVNIGG